MLDNLEELYIDHAVDGRRHCKRNSLSVLSCIDKRTKEGCDRGSEIGTVLTPDWGQHPAALSWWCSPDPSPRGGSKWRDKFPKGSDHLVAAPSPQSYVYIKFVADV